jgi:DNA-binding response OmpR family regulator
VRTGAKRRALVVEDEVVIGMLIEDMLAELGHEVVAISTHLEEALRLARSSNIDFAILDVNLNGQRSLPVADVLQQRSVPFMFATGYGSKVLRSPYQDIATLQKPFELEELKRVLSEVLA